jgi:hypothetical protein
MESFLDHAYSIADTDDFMTQHYFSVIQMALDEYRTIMRQPDAVPKP